jgi:hypothetical protein
MKQLSCEAAPNRDPGLYLGRALIDLGNEDSGRGAPCTLLVRGGMTKSDTPWLYVTKIAVRVTG